VATPTQVRVAGELWQARSDSPLRVGESVVVREVDGLTLVVA
jgi:membrane-bound serine protease (ClpP class)